MNDVDQGHVGDDGRQKGVLDHLHIGDAHVFDHQKRCGAHDRRHQLAVGRTGHLDGAGLFRLEADLFHQRDREGPGGDHVGDGRARHQTGQSGRYHGGLGRPAAQVAQSGKGGADKVVAGAGRLQQGAKEHEHEDHAGGHAQSHAVDAFGGQPVVRHALGQAGPLVSDDLGHVRPAEGVNDEHGRHHHQGRSQGPAGGLQQQGQARNGHHQIHGGGIAWPIRQGRIKPEQVGGAESRYQSKDPVLNRYVVARRRFEGRIGRVGEEYGEGQVNGPGFSVVEHENIENEGQRRSVPQLKQRP